MILFKCIKIISLRNYLPMSILKNYRNVGCDRFAITSIIPLAVTLTGKLEFISIVQFAQGNMFCRIIIFHITLMNKSKKHVNTIHLLHGCPLQLFVTTGFSTT